MCYGLLDSSLSEEYNNGNESPSEETMTSERLARFLENVVYDETTFKKVMGSENKSLRRRMRTIFQRAINKLNHKSDKLLIKTLNNVIDEISQANSVAKIINLNIIEENKARLDIAMSLEEYKKQVEQCLIKNCNCTEAEAKDLIRENYQDLEWFLNKKVTPFETAHVFVSPLW